MSTIIDVVLGGDTFLDVVMPAEEIVDVTLEQVVIDVLGTTEAGPQGPPGADGIDGATGPAGIDAGPLAYTHSQGTPASTWTIVHNLGFRPNVAAFDSAGSPAEGTVQHIDDTALTISFTSAGAPASFGGVAYLS